MREAQKGLQGVMKDAFGIGASGKRKIGSGSVSMELSFKPGALPHVRRPFEDEVRRDVICPHCSLDQTVFGLAAWCADCGQDIFMVHVAAELDVTRLMVGDVARREEVLGKRVAAKDLENCLEDAVSIFEASIKAIVRRALANRGESPEQIQAHIRKLGNSFQSIQRTREQLSNLFGHELGGDAKWDELTASFEKRHPVAHNLGVIDRKYLERVQAAEREGREVRVTAAEVQSLLAQVKEAVESVYNGIIGNGPQT